MRICIAGKNQIACNVLHHLIDSGYTNKQLSVIPNRDDVGKHTWQPSIAFVAERHKVPVWSLEQAEDSHDLMFVSVEFDRILRPSRFKTTQLYNIHFSLLPAYRGVATSVLPILHGANTTGVSIHQIDHGVDTGDVIYQKAVEILPNWSSRDLYFQLMETGEELLTSKIQDLIDGSFTPTPQQVTGASYFSRRDVDFGTPPIVTNGTAWQASCSLRAFMFHEYQYPELDVGQVMGASISTSVSSRCATERTGAWTAVLHTRDRSVDLILSPFNSLYQWCRTTEDKPEHLDSHPMLNSIVNRADRNGWTPLMVACYHGNSEAIETLLEWGADVNQSNLRGTTPLMYAKDCRSRNAQAIVRQVLDAGADVTVRDAYGKTVIDYASENNQQAFLRQI